MSPGPLSRVSPAGGPVSSSTMDEIGPPTSAPSPADQSVSVAFSRHPRRSMWRNTRALPLPPYDHTLVDPYADPPG